MAPSSQTEDESQTASPTTEFHHVQRLIVDDVFTLHSDEKDFGADFPAAHLTKQTSFPLADSQLKKNWDWMQPPQLK